MNLPSEGELALKPDSQLVKFKEESLKLDREFWSSYFRVVEPDIS